MQRTMTEIHSVLDERARSQRHREFSIARLVGGLAQALVIGLLAWAVSDWGLQAPMEALLVKLGFAAVLQLVTLTAFAAALREG